jgi:hypothetical protein
VINCTGATLAAVGGQSLDSRLVTQGWLVADDDGLGYQCNESGADRGTLGDIGEPCPKLAVHLKTSAQEEN